MRKALLIALAATVALLVSASASADIVRSEPGGEITLRSLGRILLNNQIIEVSCRMTLRGRFAASARGDLFGALDAKPQIAELTGGEVEDCSRNSTVRLLFETFFPWLVFTAGITEARRFSVNVLNVQYLIRVPIIMECLYRVLVRLDYDGDLMFVASIMSLQVTRLEMIRTSCPIPPIFVGAFDLEPDQELILEREI